MEYVWNEVEEKKEVAPCCFVVPSVVGVRRMLRPGRSMGFPVPLYIEAIWSCY